MATSSETPEASDQKRRVESIRAWIGLLTGLIFIFLATALYGIGRAYREGYLYQLGLDLNQVPEDFYGYLYWGYLGGVGLSFGWFLYLVLGFLVLAAISYGIRQLATKWELLGKAVTSWDDFPRERTFASHHKYVGLAALTAASAYIIIITYFVVSAAHEHGLETGSNLISHLKNSHEADRATDTHWIELTWYGEGSKRTLPGYRLLCTQDLCAIYNPAPDGLGLMVVPLDERPEIRILEKPRTTRSQSSPANDGNTSRDGSSRSQG